MELAIPEFKDILSARRIIRQYLSPTPLYNYPALDQLLGARIFVKHENYQPIGVFKIRGGINLISQLTPQEKVTGVMTASTGNHGQSIAFASKLFGVRATIYVPENANRVKVTAIRNQGADVVFHGVDFDEAKAYCEQVARDTGQRYISAGDEPLLIAGVGTHTLEILEEQPDVEMIFVPVGSGTGASGACIAARTLKPETQVIAVQSSGAPSAYLTWKTRTWTEAKMETIAEGVATRAPFMLPQRILWEHLHDFLLVDDEEMKRCVAVLLEKAKTLVEPAGAAPLAAALRMRDQIAGRTIALILSGGNITPEQLKGCL